MPFGAGVVFAKALFQLSLVATLRTMCSEGKIILTKCLVSFRAKCPRSLKYLVLA